jgi:hypothetical protein
VIDLDLAFAQQFLGISIRQAVTQIPTHRQYEHVWPEAVSGELDLDAGPRGWR